VWASAPVGDWQVLVAGSFAGSVSLPRDPDAASTAWIEQVFDEPVTVAAVTAGLPGPRGFGAAPPPSARLEVSDDGVAYHPVAELAVLEEPTGKAVPVAGRSGPRSGVWPHMGLHRPRTRRWADGL
jgi:hypothetical protein